MNRKYPLFILLWGLIILFFTISGCYSGESDINDSDMVFISAGLFIMGDSSGSAYPDQFFAHKVFLDAYYIDKYEVTFQEYEKFIKAGGYQKREFWTEDGWKFIQQNQIKGYLVLGQKGADKSVQKLYNALDQPVIGVSWYEADAYARWAGKRLPTEAEWEKAARGSQGYKYPWGNEMVWENISYKITNGKRTVPVGSFPGGASPYGVIDMAGNVWEWCSDWYDETYYSKSPSKNPQGPINGIYRVLRGGSWGSNRVQLQSTYRYYDNPTYRGFNVGFRCVKDVK